MEKCFVSIFLLFFKDTSIFKKSIETYNTYSSEYSRLIEDASFFFVNAFASMFQKKKVLADVLRVCKAKL